MSDQLEVFAVLIAAPDRARPAIGLVAGPGFAVLVHQAGDTLIADAEIEFTVGADQDAVHAMIVIDAAKTTEQLAWRPVGFAVAILIFEDEDVGGLTYEDGVAGA